MARRSFSRFRPRSFRGSRRARSAARPIYKGSRWQIANFQFSAQTSVNSGVGSVYNMFELIKVFDHVGDSATGSGVTLMQMTDRIEIGGIIWDSDVRMIQAPVGAVSAFAICSEYVHTMRLDATGQPVTVPSFDITQKPIAIVSAAVSGLARDDDMPDRVHHRENWLEAIGANNNANAVNSVRIRRTRSLRLRRSLSDLQGLYLQLGAQQSSGAAVLFLYFAAGALYFRVKF